MYSTLLALALLSADPTTAPEPEPLTLPTLNVPTASSLQDEFDTTVQSDWYLQVGFQTVTTRSSDGPDEEIDFDEGFAASLLLGRRFQWSEDGRLGFSGELEGIYSDQESETDEFFAAVRDVTGLSVLVNGVADYALTDRFALYGGGGLGLSLLDVGSENDDLDAFDDEDGPFLSWQAKAGLLFQATDSLVIDVGYRFLNIDDAEIDDSNGNADFDLQTRQHMLGLGLRFDL